MLIAFDLQLKFMFPCTTAIAESALCFSLTINVQKTSTNADIPHLRPGISSGF